VREVFFRAEAIKNYVRGVRQVRPSLNYAPWICKETIFVSNDVSRRNRNESDVAWDIFCRVVDNFGDIGVCWRLARQLIAEHGFSVRLWVDDLVTFSRISSTIDATLDQQTLAGIDVCRWREPFPDVVPGDVVIEAFACELPAKFKQAMAEKTNALAWINLEYLSAEPWVTGTHRLPSPQAALTKYFFFPGFVPETGGLLRERDLIGNRKKFQAIDTLQAEFWQSLGLTAPKLNELRVSLFCYDNPALPTLLQQIAAGKSAVTLLVPVGVASKALEKIFDAPLCEVGQSTSVGNLTLRVIPFLDHERYDQLLWACDVNFVRGEDSFVRAQWAARPFVWHIYPQTENAHRIKLDAFLDLFCADMPAAVSIQVRSFWHAWNGAGLAPTAWEKWLEIRSNIGFQASAWAEKMAQQSDLATALVRFSGDLLKSRVSN
jgi:uncharacterized repeat protein (TIGR03837 family)